jgi:hypothetical protein
MRHWDLELPRWPGDWQGLEILVERGDLPPIVHGLTPYEAFRRG